jgi:hypothetical protein
VGIEIQISASGAVRNTDLGSQAFLSAGARQQSSQKHAWPAVRGRLTPSIQSRGQSSPSHSRLRLNHFADSFLQVLDVKLCIVPVLHLCVYPQKKHKPPKINESLPSCRLNVCLLNVCRSHVGADDSGRGELSRREGSRSRSWSSAPAA